MCNFSSLPRTVWFGVRLVERRNLLFLFLDYSGKSAQMRLSAGKLLHRKKEMVFFERCEHDFGGKKTEGSSLYIAEVL